MSELTPTKHAELLTDAVRMFSDQHNDHCLFIIHGEPVQILAAKDNHYLVKYLNGDCASILDLTNCDFEAYCDKAVEMNNRKLTTS